MKTKTMKDSASKLITNWANAELAHEDITFAAYYLWNQEGRPEGRDVEHWLHAKALLQQAPQQGAVRM